LPEISIVIPVYNEEACLPELSRVLDAFLASFPHETEVILVDDGSTDRSLGVMNQIASARAGWRLVSLRANRGQTTAMAAGLDVARGEIIIFMDADLQNDPADIPVLIARLQQGFDLVSGWRRHRKDRALTRRLPSALANRLIGWVTGVRVHDYGCTLKAYRASIVKPLNLYSDMHRFLPALCSQSGARITEVEVNHRPRMLGTSKYGLDRIFKVLADLTVIKMIVTFADRPMHYFGLVSLGFLFLTVLTVGLWGYNLYRDFHEGSIILPAVVVLCFCCFLYFLFMGLLAELITKVFCREPPEAARASAVEI
jgi:glycosyltransferase involved in cell wall biosynthesis